jgi:hypothetical protein
MRKGLRRGSKEPPTSTNAVDDSVTEVSKDNGLESLNFKKTKGKPYISIADKTCTLLHTHLQAR